MRVTPDFTEGWAITSLHSFEVSKTKFSAFLNVSSMTYENLSNEILAKTCLELLQPIRILL